MCVCVVSVIVKRPVLPPSVVDGRSRNPLYSYSYSYCLTIYKCFHCLQLAVLQVFFIKYS